MENLRTNQPNDSIGKSAYELRKEAYEKRHAGEKMKSADDAISHAAEAIVIKGTTNLNDIAKLTEKGVDRYSEATLREMKIGQESLARFNKDELNKVTMKAILGKDFDTDPESYRKAVIKLSNAVGAPTRFGVISPKLIEAMVLAPARTFTPDQVTAINMLYDHQQELIAARQRKSKINPNV